MLDQAFVQKVRDIVALEVPGIDLDTPLREAGLNSLGTVATLVAIENEFDISLPDELINPRTFHSVRSLAEAVASVLGGQLNSEAS